MRFSKCILAALASLTVPSVDGAVRFGEPREFPDVGLSLPLPEDAVAEPFDLPKAAAFAVTETNGVQRLEDRFDVLDLWSALSLRGRWRDAYGNRLFLARLTAEAPDASDVDEEWTRVRFRNGLKRLAADSAERRDEAVAFASPVEVGAPVRPRRSQRKNFSELLHYPAASNDFAFVYAFRPRLSDPHLKPDWYVAALVPAPGEDAEAAGKAFDEAFLDRVSGLPDFCEDEVWRDAPSAPARKKKGASPLAEEDLLRRDYRRAVANYADWHFAAGDGVAVVDDVAVGRERYLQALTNDLPRMRRAYARVAPSPLGGEPHVALVRVFGSQIEYLAYVGVEQQWTAAVWTPARRELVAWVPERGVEELLRTTWHEAFHQHLSYAAMMSTASPWFNEGHAELFENAHVGEDGEVVFDLDADAASFVRQNADALAEAIPAFLLLDYDGFYAENAAVRLANYRLAWSIAYFLEIGAPDVRFRPFENLRADYVKALVKTRDRAQATAEVLPEPLLKELVREWKKFWKK
ncbi:MAG: DUF1570 domain-containing protein [Kiritimatiellae bacterium]|nr:DUF1570 domain-containing protein [Kiritimatiellia bacterium]